MKIIFEIFLFYRILLSTHTFDGVFINIYVKITIQKRFINLCQNV